MPIAASDGTRLYWRADGREDLPALVLINSLGTDHAMWTPVLDGLLRRFKVIRYDTRGHGASDAPPGDYSIGMLARDTLAVADAAGARTFVLCGVSLGGMTAAWLAARHPDRVERAVLANTAASMDPANMQQRIDAVRAGGMQAVVQTSVARFLTPRYLARSTPYAATLERTMRSLDPVGYGGCCAAIRDLAIEPLVPTIRVPVMVVVGSDDPSTPPARGRALAAAIPRASVVELKSFHFSHAEQPAAFLAAVVPFLAGDAGAGATKAAKATKATKTKQATRGRTTTATPKQRDRTKRATAKRAPAKRSRARAGRA